MKDTLAIHQRQQARTFSRMMMSPKIWIERKKTFKFEQERLRYIKGRIAELQTISSGLIGDMLEKQLDLIIVLSLRNKYEKKISQLPKKEQERPVKRLAIFKEETQTFKNEYIKSNVARPPQAASKSVRHASKEIDNLLMRVFNLTPTQKNQLLLLTKEYRELNQERNTIFRRNS